MSFGELLLLPLHAGFASQLCVDCCCEIGTCARACCHLLEESAVTIMRIDVLHDTDPALGLVIHGGAPSFGVV